MENSHISPIQEYSNTSTDESPYVPAVVGGFAEVDADALMAALLDLSRERMIFVGCAVVTVPLSHKPSLGNGLDAVTK